MIPKTETDLQRVVVNREIRPMYNQVEDPVREHGQANDQRRAVRSSCALHQFIDKESSSRPDQCADEAVRVWHVIYLFNPKKNKRRPQKIEQLDGNKQNHN